MSAAELAVWVPVAAALVMGGWRLLRALLAIIRALESVGELSATFAQWTTDMREWQGQTESRLVRLETLSMVGEHR